MGEYCDQDVNECDSSPCQNDGECVNLVNKYMCICKPGFDGMNCDNGINECRHGFCQNGGMCHDRYVDKLLYSLILLTTLSPCFFYFQVL